MPDISILGQGGHVQITWDPTNHDEVERAREEFDRLRAAGYLIFTVEEQIENFDRRPTKLEARFDKPLERPAQEVHATQTEELQPKKRHVAVPRMRGG